jgi:Na+/proline symporter
MSKPIIDLRRYSQETKKRLIWGGLALIFIVGLALIALTYGTPSALCGLAFLLLGLLPIALILLILAVLQWLTNRLDKDDR